MESPKSSSVKTPLVKKRFRFAKRIHHPMLYVVANRTEAVFYARSRRDPFHFVGRLDNPDGRPAERELSSDRPGRVAAPTGGGGKRHGLEPRTTKHEAIARKFARRIARELAKYREENAYEGAILVAEPHFLGLLRAVLPDSAKDFVRDEIAREFKRGSDRMIGARIQRQLTAAIPRSV